MTDRKQRAIDLRNEADERQRARERQTKVSERKEGLTVEEELQDKLQELVNIGDDNTTLRIVDLIKELIDDRAGEKAEEAIGLHKDDYDHDLLYNR